MFYVSAVSTVAPSEFQTKLQEKAYTTLLQLGIEFERVQTDEAITMEDCLIINERLKVSMVKTLFLCNRQQTEFYLFITTADKPFRSKDLSNQLGIARLSFASVEMLQNLLGTKVGAATILGVLLDPEQKVKILIDHEITQQEWYGCSDGTTTGYMRVRMDRILNELLSYTKHKPIIVKL